MRSILLLIIIFSLSNCLLYESDNGLTFFKPYYMNRERVVVKKDLEILEMAMKLLSDESQWNREDDRLCFYKEKWSLFCALAKATVKITSKYNHRRVALQEIRFTINDKFPERWKKHQLQGFNNHKSTTYSDLKWVLDETKKRLERRFEVKAGT